MKKIHYSNLAEYHHFLGLKSPEHPLFSVATISTDTSTDCSNLDVGITTDFYSLSLKKILSGEIHYGRTKFDFKNGSLICLAPRQSVRTRGVKTKSNAKIVLIHEDFFRGTRIKEKLDNATYFSYSVNEALHLSPKEERLIQSVFDNIEQEYNDNHDDFSKDILISQLDTLLIYADRFYRRQFQQRSEVNASTKNKFIESYKQLSKDSIPSVEEIAQDMNMTARYLSDALKVETGNTAIGNLHLHLIDQAKNLLLASTESVSTIAYQLGFEYPQYFSRLFKNKVGMTPTEYREKIH